MSKNNLKRKQQVLTLISQGLSGPDIRATLGISQGIYNHTLTWLIDNSYARRVSQGKYVATGKPWPIPHSGNVELLGRVGALYILSRPHPHFRYEVDYFGALIKEEHLEIKTVGLGTLLKTMVRYPAALPMTAISLSNLKAAVGLG